MKIAVIGGGAAGLVTAYLLDPAHDVHLFERHPILGGNARTLGGNVENSKLEDGVITENGVSWFHGRTYPNMHRLLRELDVEHSSRLLDSSIILANGEHCHMSVLDCFSHSVWDLPVSEVVNFGEVAYEVYHALRQFDTLTESELTRAPLKDYLDDFSHLIAQWLRGGVAASFSVPFQNVGQFPMDMIFPLFQSFLHDRHCTVLPGGIFSYMQQILNRFQGVIHTDCPVQSVCRRNDTVLVTVAGDTEVFDCVVLATTPECGYRLLADPSPAETRCLGIWRDSTTRTVAHVSETMYEQRQIPYRTPGDCFERPDDGVVGYNCCLNDLYGIRSNRQYSFGAQLEDWIDASDILDIQHHLTPLYELNATAQREEIRGISGENNTYYAGAYLYDGLHEGAVMSALDVSEKLGGRTF